MDKEELYEIQYKPRVYYSMSIFHIYAGTYWLTFIFNTQEPVCPELFRQ